MIDSVDAATRSRMMSAIRGVNIAPEKLVRSLLHRAGFRFRLHRRDLPGKPDIVLPKHHAVIFVNGCFWHRHRCASFRWPKSNVAFWRQKLNGNAKRDKTSTKALRNDGWRVLVIWECALEGNFHCRPADIVRAIRKWLVSTEITGELTPREGGYAR